MGWFSKEPVAVKSEEEKRQEAVRQIVNWKPECMRLAISAGRDEGRTIVETAQAIWDWIVNEPEPKRNESQEEDK